MQILCGGASLHSVARDGVKVVNTSGTGNAVTCISISKGKDITLCKGASFAKAYNGNASCVEYANKASAYSGGGVGSGTKGIYIDSATGKPKAMNHCLEKDITSNTLLFTELGTGLCMNSGSLSIKFANSVSSNSELPVTAAQVKAYIDQVIADL